MLFRAVLFVWEMVFDVFAILRLSDDDKDLEILLLRYQLRLAERQQSRGPTIPRWQKVPLVVLVVRLKNTIEDHRERLDASLQLFKPDTVIGWHRNLVRTKWTFEQGNKPGRPSIASELEGWILQVAKDNPTLGYDKLEGEMRKLGFTVSATTIRTVLQRHGIPPASERMRKGSSWRTFLNHYKDHFLACDFFTVETLMLQTIYVLFFIEHSTRRVHFCGCTTHPHAGWVTQQARQMNWEIRDREIPMGYLIHDRGTKFTHTFDTVFKSEGLEIVKTPFRARNANAFAERWVRSVRQECLDRLIILNERHLRQVLKEYVDYYNTRRPHQGLAQDSPLHLPSVPTTTPIGCRQVLGGTIRDYYHKAA